MHSLFDRWYGGKRMGIRWIYISSANGCLCNGCRIVVLKGTLYLSLILFYFSFVAVNVVGNNMKRQVRFFLFVLLFCFRYLIFLSMNDDYIHKAGSLYVRKDAPLLFPWSLTLNINAALIQIFNKKRNITQPYFSSLLCI